MKEEKGSTLDNSRSVKVQGWDSLPPRETISPWRIEKKCIRWNTLWLSRCMIAFKWKLSKQKGDSWVRFNTPDSLTVWMKSLGHPETATKWGFVETTDKTRERAIPFPQPEEDSAARSDRRKLWRGCPPSRNEWRHAWIFPRPQIQEQTVQWWAGAALKSFRRQVKKWWKMTCNTKRNWGR